MLRYYGFSALEILDEKHQSLNPYIDPKCNWALNHLELFPVDVNKADYESLLRVPGIGPTSAKRIITARRTTRLSFDDLKKLGVVLKRAEYFITYRGKTTLGVKISQDSILRSLMSDKELSLLSLNGYKQLSFFDGDIEGVVKKCLTGKT